VRPKVAAATSGSLLGGSLVTIVVWALGLRGIVVPDAVAVALTIVASTLTTGLAGYFTPDAPKGP
jgi:hypothetical protein